jgi:hypothetical protein
MKNPIQAGASPNLSDKNIGTKALYTLQITLTPKNPNPSRNILP